MGQTVSGRSGAGRHPQVPLGDEGALGGFAVGLVVEHELGRAVFDAEQLDLVATGAWAAPRMGGRDQQRRAAAEGTGQQHLGVGGDAQFQGVGWQGLQGHGGRCPFRVRGGQCVKSL